MACLTGAGVGGLEGAGEDTAVVSALALAVEAERRQRVAAEAALESQLQASAGE